MNRSDNEPLNNEETTSEVRNNENAKKTWHRPKLEPLASFDETEGGGDVVSDGTFNS